MTITSDRRAFVRHHLCEVVLFALLAAPVLLVRPGLDNFVAVAVFALVYAGIGYVSDMPARMRADEDGLHYLEGGTDRRFLAWPEITRLVPRRFRGWPAENALVALDRDGNPLLVATTSMFADADLRVLLEVSRRHVPVDQPVALSPFNGRANGTPRPDLVPERTSERFLASAVQGLLLAIVAALIILLIVER